MPDFLPPRAPDGPITEVFPDVFSVTGGFGFGPGLSITRNMTIVRQGEELTLLNSVRLSPEREVELDKLGKVKHLVRVGFFHGVDDPYYVNRYAPTYWAPTGTRPGDGPAPTREIKLGESPIAQSTVFTFERGKRPEVALLLERDGGILVTCDSYQNWTTFAGCSLLGGVMMRAMGFGPTLIGGPWTKAMGTDVREDFARLRALEFRHLVPAHGTVLRDEAKAGLTTAIAKRFG